MINVRIRASNLTSSQTPKANRAVEIAEKAINSDKFKEKILSYNFSDVRIFLNDGATSSDLTNSEIYRIISEGIEVGSNPDRSIDLDIKIYKKLFTSAIGYTKDGVIYTRDKFFYGSEISELAGHWIHEWLHTAGFIHDFRRTQRRTGSVPYAVGEIVAELGAKIDIEESQTLVVDRV